VNVKSSIAEITEPKFEIKANIIAKIIIGIWKFLNIFNLIL
jgi:hypothetical protein